MRVLTAAGPDYLRGDGLRNKPLLEGKQRLQAARLPGILCKAHLFKPQTVNLLLQIVVLRSHVAKVDVVMPDAAYAITYGIECLFSRNKYLHNPQPDERHRLSGARHRTTHLRCEHNDLRHQEPEQDGYVPISCEEIFHLQNYFTTEPQSASGDLVIG